MATMVRFQEVFSHDGSLWFRTWDNEVLSVKSLNDGVMVIDPMIGTNIQKTAAIVAGCFDEESNLNGLKAIEFDFNGVYISVNAKNAQVDTILKMFEDGWQKNCEEAEARRREYEKTPEYRAERAKALKIQRRREQVHQLVLDTDKSSEMEFKDEEAHKLWDEFCAKQAEDETGYSQCVVDYARYWAKFMQYLKEKHNVSVIQIAGRASHDADVNGITGFMYGCAVNVLSQVWKYGEELRVWHNKQYGHEGDGVVNPAVLTVSVG